MPTVAPIAVLPLQKQSRLKTCYHKRQMSNDYENQHIPATRTFQKTSNKGASFAHFNLLRN